MFIDWKNPTIYLVIFLITWLRTGFTFQEINQTGEIKNLQLCQSFRIGGEGKRIDEDELIIERTKRRSVIRYFYGSTVAIQKKKKKSTKLSYPKISPKSHSTLFNSINRERSTDEIILEREN